MNIYVILIMIIACALLGLTYYVHRKKKKLDEYIESNKNVAVILLINRHKNDEEYAEENIITEIDGLKADVFNYKIGIPAICAPVGNHILIAKSKWKVRGKKREKNLSLEKMTEPISLHVTLEQAKYYSLNYNIKKKEFEFEECDIDNLFD